MVEITAEPLTYGTQISGVYGAKRSKNNGEYESHEICSTLDNIDHLYVELEKTVNALLDETTKWKLFNDQGKVTFRAANLIWKRIYYPALAYTSEVRERDITNSVRELCLDHFLSTYFDFMECRNRKVIDIE